MKAGIVGLPNVGKSTLFNALTAPVESANYPFCTIEPNVGIGSMHASMKSTRLSTPRRSFPQWWRSSTSQGFTQGASQGEGLATNSWATSAPPMPLHVVRCFQNEDITHVDGAIDPIRDIETIDTELKADLESMERQIDKVAKSGDKDAKTQMALYEPALKLPEEGTPLRSGNGRKPTPPPCAAAASSPSSPCSMSAMWTRTRPSRATSSPSG